MLELTERERCLIYIGVLYGTTTTLRQVIDVPLEDLSTAFDRTLNIFRKNRFRSISDDDIIDMMTEAHVELNRAQDIIKMIMSGDIK